MSALVLNTPCALAAALMKKYAGGIAGLACRAGWTRGDVSQQAWVAAAEALQDFDPARGGILSRAWWFLRQAARKSGFVPRGGSGGEGDESGGLDQAAGDDDPAEILAATQEFERLGLDKYVERIDGSLRSRRRWRVEARGAAAAALRGEVGSQGELF